MTGDPLLSRFYVTGVFIRKYYNASPGSTVVSGVVTPSSTGSERYYLSTMSFFGLGVPVPLIYSSDAYRMDGTTYAGTNIQNRTVTVQIPVLGDVITKKAEIYKIFAKDPALTEYTYYDLCIETDINYTLILRNVNLLGVEPEVRSPIGHILTITIFCKDPIIYANTERNYLAVFSPSIYGPPTDMLSSHSIEPYGTWYTYPRIIVAGSCANFGIENKSNGKKIQLNMTMGSTEVVSIITQPGPYQKISSNVARPKIGYNIISLVEGGCLDFSLDPTYGVNDVEVTGAKLVNSPVTNLTLYWVDCYVGL
jgi:hypothetical protein